ncbi:hypothetical protein ACOSQ3_011110 [Xanthoceras sorbifolium]
MRSSISRYDGQRIINLRQGAGTLIARLSSERYVKRIARFGMSRNLTVFTHVHWMYMIQTGGVSSAVIGELFAPKVNTKSHVIQPIDIISEMKEQHGGIRSCGKRWTTMLEILLGHLHLNKEHCNKM